MEEPEYATGPAVRKAAQSFGSAAQLARHLDVTKAFMSYLTNGQRRVPNRLVQPIVDATGVPAWELRPDRYARPE